MQRSKYGLLEDSIDIMKENASSVFEKHEIAAILEDVNSPIRMKYNQKLYDSVINKKHIDFDDIPNSKGDIENYSGIKPMRETLKVIRELDAFQKTDVMNYVSTIETAIDNIAALKNIYTQGFAFKSDYVMLEYCSYVYACVEATTTILYEFVDFIKKPGTEPYQVVLKNTTYRANLFYIQQLEKFNEVNRTMLADYRNFLMASIKGDKDNFVGSSMIVGSVAITVAAASVIPITRELIRRFYETKRKLSDYLLYQAQFLEMNRACVEANGSFTAEKKKNILAKQEKIRQKMVRLGEALRASDVKTNEKAKRELERENAEFKVSAIRNDVENSPLQLL